MLDDCLDPISRDTLSAQNAALTPDPLRVDPTSFAMHHSLTLEIERIDGLIGDMEPREQQRLWALRQNALWARSRLDQAHERLFAVYRRRIRENTLTPEAFRALLGIYATPARQETWSDPPPYDDLDTLVDRLFSIDTPPPAQSPVEAEMVPYQPTPVRIVLDMANRLALSPGDVFYDLGAGLGRVVFVMDLVSAGQMKGVEVERAYVEFAQGRARDLNLAQVTFINADARAVDYADGTVFFLYTPFKRTILRRVLTLLRAQAGTRPIRICSYGPGTLEIQDQDWLTSADDPDRDVHHVTIFESRRPSRSSTVRRWRRRM